MDQTRDVAALLGRILLAIIFIKSGFGKIGGFEGTVAAIASKGIPLPQVAAAITIAIELGGGLLLLVGWKARWAALLIFLFAYPDDAHVPQFLGRAARAVHEPAEPLSQECRDHGRHADGVGLRPRPPFGRPRGRTR